MLYPRYPWEKEKKKKKKPTAFLSYYRLLSAPQTQPRQAGRSCHQPCGERAPCSGTAKVQSCKRRRVRRGAGDREPSFSAGANNTLQGTAPLHGVKGRSKNKQLKTGDHKMRNVCGVRDTKENRGFILKQMYKENPASPHVTIRFLEFSQSQTHEDQKHVSKSVKMERKKAPSPSVHKRKKPAAAAAAAAPEIARAGLSAGRASRAAPLRRVL